MKEQFYDLSQEKQLAIINAGLEVFARNDYRHAVTDDIARKAGISKGLLFYYFQNKKALYLFLFEYSARLIVNDIMDGDTAEMTDFFERMEYAAERKVRLLERTPYLSDFVMRCFYENGENIAEELERMFQARASQAFETYFENIDLGKFREDVRPREIYEMLTWMTEGYIHDKQRKGQDMDIGELMKLFYTWERRLKQIAYREEYQEGGK